MVGTNGIFRGSPKDFIKTTEGEYINTSPASNKIKLGNIFDIVHLLAPDKFYISAKASQGILRRKTTRKINMNPFLEELFTRNCIAVSQCKSIEVKEA